MLVMCSLLPEDYFDLEILEFWPIVLGNVRFYAQISYVTKKADSLCPVVSGASIVAKVTRDRALREWIFEETAENVHRNFGSGYPGDLQTNARLEDHKHNVFGFPSWVRFSWGTCTSYYKDIAEGLW